MTIGEISSPVQSTSGYHIIQLIGKEVRPLSSTDLDSKKAAAFSEWLTAEKENVTIEKYDTVWKAVVPSEPVFGQ
jgi:parvulin-like peptidyl-prolyl isomerase